MPLTMKTIRKFHLRRVFRRRKKRSTKVELQAEKNLDESTRSMSNVFVADTQTQVREDDVKEAEADEEKLTFLSIKRKEFRENKRKSIYLSALLHPKKPSHERLLISALAIVAVSLSLFTYAGKENRKLALYSPIVVPIMAITSISPFLLVSTPLMLKSRRTGALCAMEWIHCLAAMFHHIFEWPFLVTIAGYVFPFYSLTMQFIKENDYESIQKKGRRSSLSQVEPSSMFQKLDKTAAASVIIYFFLWSYFGQIFVLAGAGPMIALAPFTRHKMYVSDYANFGMLGFLFFAENLCIIHGAMTPAQVLHFVSHFSISYVFHSINRKHFFPEIVKNKEH